MVTINLARKSYNTPASPASRRRTIGLHKLNRETLVMLRNLISYRNAKTGEGFFWSGAHVKYKLRSGYRQFMLNEVDALLYEMKQMKDTPVNAVIMIEGVNNNITRIEHVIRTEVRPGLTRVAHEVMETYKEVATSETGDYAHIFTQQLAIAIRPYEARTLKCLESIDAEMDVLLSIFGLTRHTDPASLNRT